MRNPLLQFFPIVLCLMISCSNSKEKQTENKEPVATKEEKTEYPECDELLRMFHTVSINNRSIVLRKDISSLKDVTNKTNDHIYSLKKGTFQVADSMAVEVNIKNEIISIIAAYEYEPEFSNDTAYIHELHKFQKMLCKSGKEYTHTGKDVSFKVTKWEAGNIIYELIEEDKKGKKKCYSVIFDKELYYQKLKPTVDLTGKDISIELGNRTHWTSLK